MIDEKRREIKDETKGFATNVSAMLLESELLPIETGQWALWVWTFIDGNKDLCRYSPRG